VSNDYSSTAFWYQGDPHKQFPPLPAAAERHPLAGDDEHDVAYRKLFALRTKAFVLLVQSIRDEKPLPDDLVELMKYDISQTYFERDYEQLMADTDALEKRLDELLTPPPSPAE
jgi:hypothetical protein